MRGQGQELCLFVNAYSVWMFMCWRESTYLVVCDGNGVPVLFHFLHHLGGLGGENRSMCSSRVWMRLAYATPQPQRARPDAEPKVSSMARAWHSDCPRYVASTQASEDCHTRAAATRSRMMTARLVLQACDALEPQRKDLSVTILELGGKLWTALRLH